MIHMSFAIRHLINISTDYFYMYIIHFTIYITLQTIYNGYNYCNSIQGVISFAQSISIWNFTSFDSWSLPRVFQVKLSKQGEWRDVYDESDSQIKSNHAEMAYHKILRRISCCFKAISVCILLVAKLRLNVFKKSYGVGERR